MEKVNVVSKIAAVSLALIISAGLVSCAQGKKNETISTTAITKIKKLEKEYGNRIGVYILDTNSGESFGYREGDRFATASTFKALLAAAVANMRTPHELDSKRITFNETDVVPSSPISMKNLENGMTLRELCDATVRYSDNMAANALLKEIGGPEKLNQFLRSVGDQETQMERYELELNDTTTPSISDTSTPKALGEDLLNLATVRAKNKNASLVIRDWMRKNTTGDSRIRAGVPKSWDVADKTGSGPYYSNLNDIAVVTPPGGKDIIISIMSDKTTRNSLLDDAFFPEATRIALTAIGIKPHQ